MAKPRQEQKPTHAAVITHGGTTILPLEQRVWVSVGDSAARKLVRDLKPNDLVLERNTKASVSLEEIHKALLQNNLLYQQAHRSLYHYPEKGEPRPRLQEFLFRAMGLREDCSADEIKKAEKTIVQRLSRMEKHAQGLFGDKKTVDFERAKQTVGNWISGETVLPSDPEVLLALRNLDRKNFDELFGKRNEIKPGKQKTAEGTPLVWAHRHWQTVHSALTSWLSGFSDAPKSKSEQFEVPEEEKLAPESEGNGKRQKNKLAEERRLVYDTLLQPIEQKLDQQHRFMRVKEVKPLEQNASGASFGGGVVPPLSKGIVVAPSGASLPAFGISATNFHTIKREQIFLRAMLLKIFQGYELRDISGSRVNKKAGMMISILEQLDSINQKKGNYVQANDPEGTVVEYGEAMRVASRAIADLDEGNLDRKFGLEKGTALRLLELERRLRDVNPVENEWSELLMLHSEYLYIRDRANTSKKPIPPEYLLEVKQKAARLARRLNEYGIPPGVPWLPQKPGQNTASKFREFQRLKRDWFSDIPAFTSSDTPPDEKEIRALMEKVAVNKKDVEKLIDMFGRENLVEIK